MSDKKPSRAPASRRRQVPPALAAGQGAIKPLRRLNLVHEVVEQLRGQILGGRFPPGEPMPPEGRICQSFGVSRTVVREAMRILQAQGLVEVSQGRLPRVKPVDPKSVVETLGAFLQRGSHSLLNLVEVRRPLESEIAALAAERASPEHIGVLRETLRKMAAARSLDALVEADMAFHTLLAAATGNPVFPLLLGVLGDLMRESRRTTIAASGLDHALTGHAAVLAAVERHEPEAARKAMLDHLNLAEHDLQEAVP